MDKTWQPISQAPENQEVWVKYSVFASEECKRNGGADVVDAVTKAIKIGKTWCGVLGSNPHEFAYIEG